MVGLLVFQGRLGKLQGFDRLVVLIGFDIFDESVSCIEGVGCGLFGEFVVFAFDIAECIVGYSKEVALFESVV